MNAQYQLVSEAVAGTFSLRPELRVDIFERDTGNTPHFHVRDRKTLGDKFNSCIYLLTNGYYLHEGKTNVLTTKERKLLNELMDETWINNQYLTINLKINVWQALCLMWNKYNPQAIQIPRSVIVNLRKKPNYTDIWIKDASKITKRRT